MKKLILVLGLLFSVQSLAATQVIVNDGLRKLYGSIGTVSVKILGEHKNEIVISLKDVFGICRIKNVSEPLALAKKLQDPDIKASVTCAVSKHKEFIETSVVIDDLK